MASWKQTIKIWNKKALDKATTPAEREQELVDEQVQIVADADTKAANLKGQLQHAKNQLGEAQTKLAAAVKDAKLAKAYRDAHPDDANALAILNQQALNVKNAQSQIATQEGVIAQLEKAVQTTQEAVAAAHQKLLELQATVQSDVAKAAAASAVGDAAKVVGSFGDLNNVGSQLQSEHDRIDTDLEQASARLDAAQGPQAQRDFDKMKQQSELDDIINNL